MIQATMKCWVWWRNRFTWLHFFDKNTDICRLLHHKRRLVWPLQSKIQSTHFFQSYGVEEVREKYLFIYLVCKTWCQWTLTPTTSFPSGHPWIQVKICVRLPEFRLMQLYFTVQKIFKHKGTNDQKLEAINKEIKLGNWKTKTGTES